MHGHEHNDRSMHEALVALQSKKLDELCSASSNYFNLLHGVLYLDGRLLGRERPRSGNLDALESIAGTREAG